MKDKVCWLRVLSEVEDWGVEAGFLCSGDVQSTLLWIPSLLCCFRLVNLSMKDWSAELTDSVTACLVEDSRRCWSALV